MVYTNWNGNIYIYIIDEREWRAWRRREKNKKIKKGKSKIIEFYVLSIISQPLFGLG